jgi:hypothetical protein
MLLCRISCELAGCVHQPIVGSGQTNLIHLYFSRLSLAMPAKINFFKTPSSVRLVQVGLCRLPLEYQAASSQARLKSVRALPPWSALQSTNRVAMASFWISSAWWRWGEHTHPLSVYLPSRTKLWCTLQLKGQIHSPNFHSIPIFTLWSALLHRSDAGLILNRIHLGFFSSEFLSLNKQLKICHKYEIHCNTTKSINLVKRRVHCF